MTNIEILARTGEQTLYERLKPLLDGYPVAIQVLDKDQRTKKRIGQPLLVISPIKKLGVLHGLMIGLQGFGCEFMLINDIRPMPFVRVGLTAKASKILVQSLIVLYSIDTV